MGGMGEKEERKGRRGGIIVAAPSTLICRDQFNRIKSWLPFLDHNLVYSVDLVLCYVRQCLSTVGRGSIT